MNQRPEVFLVEFLKGGIRPDTVLGPRSPMYMPGQLQEDDSIMVDPESIDVDEYRNPDAPYMGPFIEEQEKYRFLLSPRSPLAEAPGYGPVIPDSMVESVTEKVIPGYTQRRDALRRKIVETLSRKGLV